MLSSETQYLFKEKIKEGKSMDEAITEIQTLKQSQLEFKNLKKEISHLNTELKNKDKEIEELKAKKSEDKNTRLKEGLGIIKQKDHKETRGASLTNIKRVIKYTILDHPYTKTELASELLIPTTVIEEILGFLNNYTSVKFSLNGSTYVRTN